MSSTLESYVNHTVSVITADGRQIVGTLKGFDQTVNVILDDSHERVYSATQGVEQVPLGLYIVRGDNVAVIGEIDEDLDNKLDFSIIKAEPLNPVIDDLVSLYRQFAKIPKPVSGRLFSGDNGRQKSLQIVWNMRDMDQLEATKFATNYSIKLTKDRTKVKHIHTIGEQINVTNDLATASRAQGSQYKAVVRKGPKDSESGKVKQILEIWDQITKIKSIDVESLEEHSTILLDPQFSNFLWSPNGKKLLYVAEYKPPKPQSYYKKAAKKSENSETENETRGQEFIFRDDWGEAFDGITHTVVAILDIDNDFKITTIELNGYSLGQPFWIGNGESVGFVGWAEDPRRLGIIYCTNRLSSIFMCDLSSKECLPKLICGSDNSSLREPRRTPDGTGFIYLENESGGPHHMASRLMLYKFKTQTNEIIVDTNGVRELIPNGNTPKYGKVCSVFAYDLPQNCFTSDGRLVLNCFNELQYVLFLVDLKTKSLKPIDFPLQSVQLIDIKDDLLVVIGSSANVTPNVFIGKLIDDNTESIEWTQIKTNSSDSFSDICCENYSIVSEDPQKLLTFVLVSPKSIETEAAATVVLPHGGPHSLLINSFMSYPLMLAKLGLKTLLVNYRGSTGVDNQYVNTLIGNVGQMDVKDVVDCIKYLTDKNLVDSSKLVLWGGSHGGFLVTHLSGQYHEMNFKACIARNPVIDMSSMPDSTDIPDWAVVEAFGKSKTFGFDTILGPDSLKVMFEKSPINWINNVKVPTLMMLGKRDRRVPMTQGLKYYRYLKAKGVKTQCHIYDDKHDLQKVDVDGDAFVNICLWIFDNLNN